MNLNEYKTQKALNIMKRLMSFGTKIYESYQPQIRLEDIVDLLKDFNNPSQVGNFCDKTFGKMLSYGSSRAVYRINDEYVIKVAYNEKGRQQNKFEYDLYRQTRSPLLTRVVAAGGNENEIFWIISEAVLEVSNEDFLKQFNLNFEEFKSIMTDVFNNSFDMDYEINMTDFLKENLDKYKKIFPNANFNSIFNFFKEIDPLIDIFHLDDQEIQTQISYGLALRNDKPYIVLLDSGLSTEIRNKYYNT